MRLKVFLPSGVLFDEITSKIIAEAENGSFCLEPKHVDFVAALVPGLMSYFSETGEEKFLAVDEGTLVKYGRVVLVSTRNAVRGTNLESLRKTVEEQYIKISHSERVARSALARLEAGIVRRYFEMRDSPP